MLIDTKTMDKMHDVQFEMLKQLINVMNSLKIKYYFVHGSLLGAIRQHDFILEDDDIDIAIFREDYNRLMNEGNALLPEGLFLQNSITDSFPLAFGKLRNTNTAFIQPNLEKYQCNQGIYIDVFPIDYSPEKSFIFDFNIKLMGIRINSNMGNDRRLLYRLSNFVSKILYPSLEQTMVMREKILSSLKRTEQVTIYGGKKTEKKMPLNWFGKGKVVKFRDIDIICPDRSDLYLTRIYGHDYLKYNPAETRINDEKKVEISACILDFEKSYRYFY